MNRQDQADFRELDVRVKAGIVLEENKQLLGYSLSFSKGVIIEVKPSIKGIDFLVVDRLKHSILPLYLPIKVQEGRRDLREAEKYAKKGICLVKLETSDDEEKVKERILKAVQDFWEMKEKDKRIIIKGGKVRLLNSEELTAEIVGAVVKGMKPYRKMLSPLRRTIRELIKKLDKK